MKETNIKTVVIIGGGFCGMMTAVHLIKKATQPLKIIIINAGYPFGKGVAYSAHTSTYLLNVRAINMSVFPEEKEHFLNWLYPQEKYASIDRSLVANIYAPRKLYGEYLSFVWEETMRSNKLADVTIIDDTASDIIKTGNSYQVHLNNNETIAADFIVLATGNNTPRPITIAQKDFYTSKKYFPNPWMKECITGVQSLKHILIVGNGLTMIDTVLGLLENGFKGTIYTISPNGFNLLPHKYNLLVYNNILEELPQQYTLLNMLTLINRHAKRLVATGIGVHLIIDALRPHVQNIWQSFSLEEKKKFLKKLSPHWNALRHRLPLHIFEQIQNMRVSKRMVAYSGRLITIKEGEDAAVVSFFDNAIQGELVLKADRVINCTGPEADILKCSNPLISKLAANKIILPDDLRLGIAAHPGNGAILNEAGEIDDSFFTIGGNLKGVIWESTAAPELRMQAQSLAETIIQKIEKNEAPGKSKNVVDNNYVE